MSTFSGEDPYSILGLTKGASYEEIRKAFKSIALKCHPDKNTNKSEKELEEVELRFKKAAWAYSLLSDKEFGVAEVEEEDFRPPEFNDSFDSTEWKYFYTSFYSAKDFKETPMTEDQITKQKEMWEEENKISDEERVQRFLRVNKVEAIDAKDIPRWSSVGTNSETTHSVEGSNLLTPKYSASSEINKIITLWRGDLTTLIIDAVVNAANTELMGGGGVDGCIHRAAGRKLYTECSLLNQCAFGNVKITRGYNMAAKYILHAAGPIGEQPSLLSSCYLNALKLSVKHNIRSIVFPCISTGTYCYPPRKAANIALSTVRQWLDKNENYKHFDQIIFCCLLYRDYRIYSEELPIYFPLPDLSIDRSSHNEDDCNKPNLSIEEPHLIETEVNM